MSEGHSQLNATNERTSEDSSLALNSGLNYLQYFSEEIGCHSQDEFFSTA